MDTDLSLVLSPRTIGYDDLYPARDLFGFQLSPDGEWFVATQRWGDQHLPVLLHSDGGFLRPMVPGGLPAGTASWSGDGELLAWAADAVYVFGANGTTPHPIARVAPVTSAAPRLYGPSRQLAMAPRRSTVEWCPNQPWLLATVRENGLDTLLVTSLDGRQQLRLWQGELRVIERSWAPDGRHILMVLQYPDGEHGFIATLSMQGRMRILMETSHHVYQDPSAVAVRGRGVLARMVRDQRSRLWVQRNEKSDPVALTPESYDVGDFVLSADGKSVLYGASVPGSGQEAVWVMSLDEPDKARKLSKEVGVSVPVAFSPQRPEVYVWHSGPSMPGELLAIELHTERCRRLTASTDPGLAPALRGPEEVVDNGVYMQLYRPVDFTEELKYAAVVWVKGGPNGKNPLMYQPFLNWLANQGFIVATVTYRGSSGQGVEWSEAVRGEGVGKNDLADVVAAARHLQQRPWVQKERIAVGGRSWGGYLALMAATLEPDLFRCAAAHAAVTDWNIQQAEGTERAFDYWIMKAWPYEEPDLFRSRSPIHLLNRLKVPVWLTHGTQDREVPFQQAQEYVRAAASAKAPVTHHFYEGQGHSLRSEEARRHYLDHLSGFLRRHLHPWNFLDNPRRSGR